MGQFVAHEPCPNCGSSDALARYAAGDASCFSCGKWYPPDGEAPSTTRTSVEDWTPTEGHYEALIKRGITEETCKKFSYQIGTNHSGQRVHIQNIKGPRGELRAQKFRTKDKNFSIQGPGAKSPGIIGAWTWPAKGKSVTISEGEIDMMSISQAFDNKWPVGSLPNGTGSVEKAILQDYDKITSFDNIVLCFDADEPGRKALDKACELLPVGKVKIMSLPEGCKDANEVLLNKALGPAALVRAFWDAKPFRPDGIVEGSVFTRERLKTKSKPGYSIRYPQLNEMLGGLRKGELTILTAGSGIGKSTLARELCYGLQQDHGLKIGNIYLEESNDVTAQAYTALHANVPLMKIMHDPDVLPDEMYDKALEEVIKPMWFYDHFGSLESERLLQKMHYLAQVGVDFIGLDHFSIATSGLESSSEGERKDIDILMTRCRSLIAETGVGIIGVVHLKRKPGTSYNEGGRVSLNDFRGSASIEQLADNAVALERDQQAEDMAAKNTSTVRVLKCRVTGRTGEADDLTYNTKTGRLDVASPFDAINEFDPHKQMESVF